jgi:hypothetical protein
MDNSALLHNVGDRAVHAGTVAEHALRGVAGRVADTATDLGGRAIDAGSALPVLRRRRRKRPVGKLVLFVVLVGAAAAVFSWRKRSSSSQLTSDGSQGIRPYPTEDPAYDRSAIDTAAARMGSTGNNSGGFDPDPTNSHDPGALHEAARRMGVEP